MNNTWASLPSTLTPERIVFISSFPNKYGYIRALTSMVLDIVVFRGHDKEIFNTTITFIKGKVEELFKVEDDSLTLQDFDAIRRSIAKVFEEDISLNHSVVVDPTSNQREALDRFKQAIFIES